MATTVLLTGTGSSLEHDFNNPIQGKYEVALQSLSTYYSWPNISSDNNELIYYIKDESAIGRKLQKSIKIPEGAYDFDSIALVIQAQLEINGHDNAFKLEANLNTLKSIITVMDDNYAVSLRESSLRTVLGWEGVVFLTEEQLRVRGRELSKMVDNERCLKSGIITKGVCVSPNTVKITDVNEILVHCNIIDGIYTPYKNMLSKQTVLTSFYPDVAPGYKINIEPTKLFFASTRLDPIQSIRVWLTDENNKPLNNKEVLTIKLRFKSLNK